jgi:hypothetical protein
MLRFAVACASAPLCIALLLATGCGQITDDSVTSANDDAGSLYGDAGQATFDGASSIDAAKIPLTGATLFAGYGEAPLSDTWAWNGSNWIEANVTGPSERDGSSMATLNGKVVLFGGEFGGYLGDTWEWDGLNWTEKKVTGPSARREAPMVAFQNKIILYGGTGDGNLDDTWSWDGTSWTQIMTPGPGDLHGVGSAMAVLGDDIYLFGGLGSANDTWMFDGATWSKVATAAGPSERCFHAMATLSDKIILFGGETDANHFLADTWEFDGTTWTQLNITGPSARFHPEMTTFPGELDHDNIVLFGGGSVVGQGAPLLGDTWSFDGSTWTHISDTGPSARCGFEMTMR